MKITLEILRYDGKKSYWQSIPYETDDENMTVAKALTEINATLDNPIKWECSCMQKKCGACAMVIDGVPRLACDTKLKDFKNKIKIEPLRKFPVVADLIVDRSILFENLKHIGSWLDSEVQPSEKAADTAYEASRCLQCGCCLEVCPNFYAGGKFFGMASIVPVSRLISELPEIKKHEIYKQYLKHGYNGCGKSLACRKICPAGIDIDSLLVNSNSIAVWKSLFFK